MRVELTGAFVPRHNFSAWWLGGSSTLCLHGVSLEHSSLADDFDVTPPAGAFPGARLGNKADVRALDPDEAGGGVDEAALIRAIVAGEKWAADMLYQRVYPSVARTLLRILHHPGPDYEDLAQTTFERVMHSLLTQQGEGVLNLAAWASGVATHVALDALRVRVRDRSRFADVDDSGVSPLERVASPTNERQLEARRQLAVVQQVLAKMKPEMAETVVLHDMVGHDLAETAALTQVTVAAAQSRLVRGRKELLRRVDLKLGKGSP